MQIKNRQQFLTILTIVAVALFAVDKILTPPLVKVWNDRKTRITKLRDDVKQAEARRRDANYLRNRWAQIQSNTLTNNTTLAEQQLFSGLNRWSEMSGITINTVTPQWKQGSDPSYKTLECRVDASGSLDRLSRFLYELETDRLTLKVQSVELTRTDNDGTAIAMGLQISGLVLNSKDQSR